MGFSDDADIGELEVHAKARGFTGWSFILVHRKDLAQFGSALTAYPLDTDARPSLSGLVGDANDVQLEVRQISALGQISLTARLIEPFMHPAPAHHQRQVAVIELLTTYERVRKFGEDLVALADRRRSDARLDEELLA
jgi:hypothetical protein